LFYEMLADEIGVTFSAAQPLTPPLERACSAIPTRVAIRIEGQSCPISAAAAAIDRATRCIG
jgi:hypothetical protein